MKKIFIKETDMPKGNEVMDKVDVVGHEKAKSFVCQTCGKGFNRKYHLGRHEKTHKNDTNSEDWAKLPAIQKQQLNSRSTNQKFVCKVCGNIFSHSKSLRVHYRKHQGKSYSCELCDKSFTSSNGLKLHRLCHEGQKPWICGKCGKQFRTKAHLSRHEIVHGSGSLTNICEICGRGFQTSKSLQVHRISHNDDKPFQCPVCGSCFKYKTSLNIHSRIHKTDQDFKCHLCNRSFSQKKTLQHHLGVHERVKEKNGYILPPSEFCEICGKGLSTKAGLRKHLKKHKDGSLKTFNRMTNREFTKLKKGDGKVSGRFTKHPHQVKVYDDIEEVIQFEIIVDENLSDTDKNDDGEVLSENADSDLTNLTLENSGIIDSKNSAISKQKTPKIQMDIRKEEKILHVDTGNDADNSKNKRSRPDGLEGNNNEKKDDVKALIKSVEHLVVIIKDKDQDKAECEVNTSSGNSTTKVSEDSNLQNSPNDTTTPTKDRVETLNANITQMEKLTDGKEDSAEKSLEDNNNEALTTKKPHMDVSVSVSISEDSDTQSENGGLFIHVEGDSDANEVIETVHEEENTYQKREEKERTNANQIEKHYGMRKSKDVTTQAIITNTDKSGENVHIYRKESRDTGDPCPTNVSAANNATVEQFSKEVSGECRLNSKNPKNAGLLEKWTNTPRAVSEGDLTESEDMNCDQLENLVEAKEDTTTDKLQINPTEQHKCDLCDKQFSRHHTLERHLKTTHLNDERQTRRKAVISGKNGEVKSKEFNLLIDNMDKSIKRVDVNLKDKHHKNYANKSEHDNASNTESENREIGRSRHLIDTCDICNKEFKQHSYFRKHMRVFHPEKEIIYKCTKENCDKSFNTKLSFKVHLKSHLETKCKLCEKEFNRTNLLVLHVFKKHDAMGEISELNGRCMICNEEIDDPSLVYEHLKTHHVSKEKPKKVTEKVHKCEICGCSFKMKQSLQRHQVLHMEDVERPQCNGCGKVFVQESHLKRHIDSQACIRDIPCPSCKERFHTEAQLRVHVTKQHKLPGYKCPICPKRYKSSSNMHRHKQTHADGTPETGRFKPYMCNVCGKCYTAPNTLSAHMLLHTIARPYKCDSCGNTYTQHAHLLRHVAVAHRGIKRFKCDASGCGKKFADKGALTVHKRIHSGEKPFECDECGKSFSQQSILLTHQRTHKDTRFYQCKYCSKVFATNASAKRHIQRHKESMKKTESVKIMNEHKKTKPPQDAKNIEKNVQCHDCGRTFTTHRAVVHKKKHCHKIHLDKISSISHPKPSRHHSDNILTHLSTVTPLFPPTGSGNLGILGTSLSGTHMSLPHAKVNNMPISDKRDNHHTYLPSSKAKPIGGNAIRRALTRTPEDFSVIKPHSESISQTVVQSTVTGPINTVAAVESVPHLVMMSNVQLYGSYQ